MRRASDTAQERRRQIFEAAIAVISVKGFHKATIREIAAAAGLGKGTIYQYIDKKEDLVPLIAEVGISLMSAKISEAASLDAPPEEKLRIAIESQLALFDEHSRLAEVMGGEIERIKHEDSELITRVFEERYLNALALLVSEAAGRERFSKEESLVVAELIAVMCLLWSHSVLAKKNAGGIEAYEALLEEFVLRGVSGRRKEAENG